LVHEVSIWVSLLGNSPHQQVCQFHPLHEGVVLVAHLVPPPPEPPPGVDTIGHQPWLYVGQDGLPAQRRDGVAMLQPVVEDRDNLVLGQRALLQQSDRLWPGLGAVR